MGLNRRVLVRRGSVAGALLITGTVWSGCAGKTATEFVAGISTQVQVPRDLAAISISVSAEDNVAYNQYFPVYNGTVELPRTLGVVNSSTPQGVPIAITIVGFDNSPGGQAAYQNATTFQAQIPTVGQAEAQYGPPGGRVLRSFRQQYTPGQILYVPMPLHYSCYDVDCGPNAANISGCTTAADPTPPDQYNPCTCKGGVCVDALNTNPLPVYNDAMAYGTTNTCFRPFTTTDSGGTKEPGCMDYGIPPQVIDATNCIYALPGTASVPAGTPPYNPDVPSVVIQAADSGGGLNVRAVFDNYVSEVLDYEGTCPGAGAPPTAQAPVEGYCTFAGAPQRFQLAAGLCSPKALHQITLLEASAQCPSKTEFQPICADSNGPPWQPTLLDGGTSSDGGCNIAKVLTPAPSQLYILFDNSSGMRDFFGPKGLQEVVGLGLTNPVFSQTQVGFSFTPATQADCTASASDDAAGPNSFLSPLLPFQPSGAAQAAIGNLLLVDGEDGGPPHQPGTDPWYLSAALEGAYGALRGNHPANGGAFNRSAVMLFFDRDFNGALDCGNGHLSALQEAQKALGEGIETYVVFLGNKDDAEDGGNGFPGQQALTDAQQLGLGLNSTYLSYFFNASTLSTIATASVNALGSVVSDLGGCVYQVPPGVGPEAILQFPDAVSASIISVSNAGSCANDDPVKSPTWVFDNQHIRVCQNTCARILTSIQAEEAETAQNNLKNGTTTPAAGISVYATQPCYSEDGGTPNPEPLVESGTVPNNYDANLDLPSEDSGSEDAGAGDAASDDAGPIDGGAG